MNQTEPKKHLNYFWVTFLALVAGGCAIWLFALKGVGLLYLLATSGVVAYAVSKLPSNIYRPDKKNRLTVFRMYCTISAYVIFVCLMTMVLCNQDYVNKISFFKNHSKSMQLIAFAGFLATSLVVSKKYEKEEKRIAQKKEHATHIHA